MRVPIEWLKEYIKFSMGPDELGTMLTMAGLEVESIENTDDDTILEVNVTPNRPDCLSILGIAREVSVLTGLPLKFPEYEIKNESGGCDVKISISDKDLCYRYAGRVVRDLRIGDSPEWMRKRLEKSGMRSVNNIVDATNYVMLEMGHPIHAFDMDKLEGRVIRAGRSATGNRITTIDGIERELPQDALLIWDSSMPVAVAGVMGGIGTEVSGGTTNIFIESAYFLSSSVRKTSRALGLKTEASYRFERGADIEIIDKALDRAALLISNISGGRVSLKEDVYARPFEPRNIKVRYERVNKVIGVSLSEDEIIEIVRKLGIRFDMHPGYFIALPPSFRTDISRETDVIEEVARCYGYNRIPVTIPRVFISRKKKNKSHSQIHDIKESMRKSGFTEAINYSFMSEAMLSMLNIPDEDPRRRTIAIRNPLRAEESLLRTMILPSLIRNLVTNISTGSKDLRLFEVSRVFIDKGGILPEERHHLGSIYFREKSPYLWKDETPDFYLFKGLFESLMEELRISDCRFEKSSELFMHPGQSADIFVFGEKAGFLGVLHPDITGRLSLKVSRPEILVMEIDIEKLLPFVPDKNAYVPVPRQPYIERDIALIVDYSLPAYNIIAQIRAYPSELIEDVSIFDFYKGKNIPESKKSVAFAIRYRAKDRTLTDSEIEALHNDVVRRVCEATGGIVRGI